MKWLFNTVRQHAVSIVIMAILMGMAIWGIQQPQKKVYNCDLAEFHPDFPVKAREACRVLRREQNGTDK
jgi:hypothetical protein